MIQEAIIHYLRIHQQSCLSLKAVLFDMDGVLYDTMPFHARAWYEVTQRHQLKSTLEDFYQFEGRTSDSTINQLYQRTFQRAATQEERNVIREEKTDLFNQYTKGVPMKGAAEILRGVEASGLRRLIVTGSSQRSLINKLDHDYPGHFSEENIVSAFNVKYGKPHPEPYLMGLQKANAGANEAIVVENAPLGVEAAVAAQIFTIAVNTGPLPDKSLLDAGADLLYPDMVSLAKDWKRIFEAAQSIHL